MDLGLSWRRLWILRLDVNDKYPIKRILNESDLHFAKTVTSDVSIVSLNGHEDRPEFHAR